MVRRRGKLVTCDRIAAGCLIAGLWLAGPQPADAALTLQLWDGVGAPVEIVDGGVGDINATAGVVRFSGPVGAFSINVTTGFSKPVVGQATLAQMDMRSLDVSGAAGSIRIRLTDTDFDQFAVNYATLIIDGSTYGTVGYNAFVDPSNTPFGTAAPAVSAGNLGPLGAGLIADFVDTLIVPPLGTDILHPYSMTMELTIHHTAAAQRTNVNATIEMTSMSSDIGIPSPATVTLLLAGLAGLIAFRRRRTGTI